MSRCRATTFGPGARASPDHHHDGESGPRAATPIGHPSASPDTGRRDSELKRILIVLSEYGYWGEELIGPLEACDAQGYEITFVTPTGQ